MKIILLSIILLSSQAVKSQTKKETIDWLNSQFRYCDVLKGGKYRNTLYEVRFQLDGSFIINSKDISTSDYSVLSSTLAYGNVKDLNPRSVVVYKTETQFNIQASCTNGTDCIVRKGTYNEDNHNTSGIGFGLFSLDRQKDLEPRLLKAIIHLINLFGGKSEVF